MPRSLIGPVDLGTHVAHVVPRAKPMSRLILERPLFSVATAFGVGLAVGGAMAPRFQRIAMAAAARYLARELLAQALSMPRDGNLIPENDNVHIESTQALD